MPPMRKSANKMLEKIADILVNNEGIPEKGKVPMPQKTRAGSSTSTITNAKDTGELNMDIKEVDELEQQPINGKGKIFSQFLRHIN